MRTSRQRPWGLWEPARLGPPERKGHRPLWTEQAPPSCSGPWGRHRRRSLRRLSPQESPSLSRAGSFLPPRGGRGPGSSLGPGLLSGLALRASAAGAFEASPHIPLLEGRVRSCRTDQDTLLGGVACEGVPETLAGVLHSGPPVGAQEDGRGRLALLWGVPSPTVCVCRCPRPTRSAHHRAVQLGHCHSLVQRRPRQRAHHPIRPRGPAFRYVHPG